MIHTLREEIHSFRQLYRETSSSKPVAQSVNQILLTPDLTREIYSLMEKSDFSGVPQLLKIIKNKRNTHKMSLDVLSHILGYLPTIGDIPKNFIELRNRVSLLIEEKKKTPGVV